MARRWRPTPFLAGSMAVHAAAAAGAVAAPPLWPWALGAVAANQALITAAGLLPRSDWLGPNLTHLPPAPHRGAERVALTIDDGPDPEVTPRLLELLAQHQLRASFFLIGERAERAPRLCRAIVDAGHRIENHSYRHAHAFSLFGPARMAADIARAQALLSDLCGRAPRFFRAPAGLRNPFLEPVLARLDLQLASWSRRAYDTREGRPQVVLDRLCRHLGDGDVLLLHDGHAARSARGDPVLLEVLPPLAERLAQSGLRTVTLDEAIR